MNLIFCGTPEFAVPTFEALISAGHRIALAVTQPDRPVGRKAELHAPPVKLAALAHNIPVIQPERIKTNDAFRAQLEAIRPDAIIVVAYGRIIPRWMLDLPPLGNINLHGSLLPKYRGAAPVQWAIANGESETGVTTMRIDEGLDTGDMLLTRALSIAPHATSPEVLAALSTIGASLMLETLTALSDGTLTPQPQEHSAATLAPILTREDALIDFTRTAQQIYNRWRAFQPWPGAHTTLRGKKLIIHRMSPASSTGIAPAELHFEGDRLLAGCANNTSIAVEEVQSEGKRRMPIAEFLHGLQLQLGERLGQ
jgi:methionyl-tRNA formyltransferase